MVKLLNWVKSGNVQKCSDKSKLWVKYKEPIGKYPKIDYSYLKDQPDDYKARQLEEDLNKEISFFFALEDEVDIRKFIEHLEYWYQISFRKKIYTKYLGLFYFVCPHQSVYQDWEFHLNFTKYNEGNYPVLVSHNFLHSHNPWVETNNTNLQGSELHGSGLDSSLIDDDLRIKLQKYKEKQLEKQAGKGTSYSQHPNRVKQSFYPSDKSKSFSSKNGFSQKLSKNNGGKSAKSKKKQKQKIVIEIDDSDDSNSHDSDGNEDNGKINLVLSKSHSEISDFTQDRSSFPNFNHLNQTRDSSEASEFKRHYKGDNDSDGELNFDTTYQIETFNNSEEWRTKMDSKHFHSLAELYWKYVSNEPISIPETVVSEIQFKSIWGIDQDEIEEDTIKEIFHKSDPTYEEQLKCKISLKNITKDSNKRLKMLYEFLSLQEMLDKEYRKYQKSFIVTSNENDSTLGMYIKIKQEKNNDLVNGSFFVDTKSQIEVVFNSKTILVYQLDKWEELALVAIFLFRQYTAELVCQFLLQLKDISGEMNEISVDMDEVFIEGIAMYQNQNKLTWFVWDEHLVRDTKDVVSISSYINSTFSVAQPVKGKELSKSDQKKMNNKKEIETIINWISSKIDRLWNKYEKIVKFSKTFTKSAIARYTKWKEDNIGDLNKEFCDVFKLLTHSIPINTKYLKEIIRSLILFNSRGVVKAFSKQSENEGPKEIKKEDKNDINEDIVWIVWRNYAPQIAQKVIMNYLWSKMWSIEIPTSIKVASSSLPNIIIKEPVIEDSKKDLKEGMLSHTIFKSYNLNPQSLAWSWSEQNEYSLSWIHKIAYLLNCLKLDLKLLFENQLIVPSKHKIKKTSRLKALYSQVLTEFEEIQKSQDKGSLCLLEQTVNEFLEIEIVWKKKIAEERKIFEERKVQLNIQPNQSIQPKILKSNGRRVWYV